MTATTDRLQALKTQPGFYIGKLSPRFILFGTSSRNGYVDVIFYSSGQDSDDIVRIVKRSACFEGAPIESVEHVGMGFYRMTLLDR